MAPQGPSGVVVRKNGQVKQRSFLYFPDDVAEGMKRLCFEQRFTISNYVSGLVEADLEKRAIARRAARAAASAAK